MTTVVLVKRELYRSAVRSAASVLLSSSLVSCGGGGGISDSDIASAPAIKAQPASVTVSELQGASFSVTATGAAPLSYQWLRNGTPIPSATSATFAIFSAPAFDHAARYSVVVRNSVGSVTSTEAVLTQELPMFLLGGQSNMEGNIDMPLFQQLLADLADTSIADLNASLAERIRYWHQVPNNGYANYGYSAKMASYEASELIRLKAAGLIGTNLTTPNPKVLCAWNESSLTPLNATPAASLNTRCAPSFGPELVLGQSLAKAGYSSTSLIKVAYGGTNLYADWRSPLMGGTPSSKALYAKLRARIQSLKSNPASVNPACKTRTCQWSAFVWFQGEADAETAFAPQYEENLKKFIADVRADVGSPNLPVVIVQIGAWAQSLNQNKGKVVATAQTAVVSADKYASIVNTADLSGFFHYDPAAQLIIGERVALAVQSLLAEAPAPK